MWLCCVVILTFLGWSSSVEAYTCTYKYVQTLNVSDKSVVATSYQIRGTAVVERIDEGLLKVKLNDLGLFISSKKLPIGTYKGTKSTIDTAENKEFFIHAKEGSILSLYVAKTEDPNIINIKKSLTNLFQFQGESGNTVETDLSGKCDIQYKITSTSITRIKTNCQSSFPSLNSDIWGGLITPRRITEIILGGSSVKSLKYNEDYVINLSIADFIESKISTEVYMELEHDNVYAQTFRNDIKYWISEAEKAHNLEYIQHYLSPDASQKPTKEGPSLKLSSVIKDNLQLLKEKGLGTINSALAGLKVSKAMKQTSYQDISSVLKSKSGKKIIGQLLDLLGGIQTPDSHAAAMEYLKINSKEFKLDLCERYLWALSASPFQSTAIITDLLSLAKNEIDDKKLLETLMQTISSMVRKSVDDSKNDELLDKTVDFIIERLKNCNKTDELCQRIYLKAFTNIRSPKALNLLIEYVLVSSRSIGVRAMKAVQALGKTHWNDEVIKLAERVYLTNGTYDSSTKVIALDILLDSNKYCYSKLVQLLKHKHASSELKEYLLQRLVQLSEKNKGVKDLIKSALITEGLHQYHALAQGGLSTVFERSFKKNGFLSTAQEIKSGLLKQGYVHINFEEKGAPETIFTLGLFSNGLSSFVSDGSDEEEEENVETSAGLELTVLGVEFRPFVFFEGQGELMGHVFSGAGSTLTPAYQAILLLKDEEAYIPLGTGELLSVGFSTIASVDLSGKIEISLWSRTAESLVQNSAGLVTEEIIKIHSPYINSEIKMELTAEPQLKLSSDIQFSSKVALCLQLEQAESVVQYNTSITTNVIGAHFKRRKVINRNIPVPGRSYALNSKNNEMCNVLFS